MDNTTGLKLHTDMKNSQSQIRKRNEQTYAMQRHSHTLAPRDG